MRILDLIFRKKEVVEAEKVFEFTTYETFSSLTDEIFIIETR